MIDKWQKNERKSEKIHSICYKNRFDVDPIDIFSVPIFLLCSDAPSRNELSDLIFNEGHNKSGVVLAQIGLYDLYLRKQVVVVILEKSNQGFYFYLNLFDLVLVHLLAIYLRKFQFNIGLAVVLLDWIVFQFELTPEDQVYIVIIHIS